MGSFERRLDIRQSFKIHRVHSLRAEAVVVNQCILLFFFFFFATIQTNLSNKKPETRGTSAEGRGCAALQAGRWRTAVKAESNGQTMISILISILISISASLHPARAVAPRGGDLLQQRLDGLHLLLHQLHLGFGHIVALHSNTSCTGLAQIARLGPTL